MADAKLPALTALSSPALDDLLYAVDVSDATDDATGSSRAISFERLLAFGLHAICQGRPTTESGVSVSTSDRSSQSTIYFTPHNGNRVALYDGTRWRFYSFTERSLSLSGLSSGANYDLFLFDNAGTLTLELSAAWASATSRTDALALQDGIWVKSGAATRRYVGTIRTTGATTTEDSDAKRFVWSAYNQVLRTLSVVDTTDSWTYATNAWRAWNNSSTNRTEFVLGLADTMVEAVMLGSGFMQSNGNEFALAIGLDSTTAPAAACRWNHQYRAGTVLTTLGVGAKYAGYPGIGYHYLAPIERAFINTITFEGDAAGAASNGLAGTVLG